MDFQETVICMTHLPHHASSRPDLQERFCRGFTNIPLLPCHPGHQKDDRSSGQPIACGISAAKRPFLNWNRSNLTGERSAIFPMPRRYTGIRSKKSIRTSHDRRRGFFVSDLPAPANALVPAQRTVPQVVCLEEFSDKYFGMTNLAPEDRVKRCSIMAYEGVSRSGAGGGGTGYILKRAPS
jgi:hypothetical protein